jgi:stage II sporulation protein D
MYRGRWGEDHRTDRAIAETAGLVLMAGDVVVPGFHHSCCGGHTADSREVYGVSSVRMPVEGVPCTWCRGSRNWGPWTLTVSWSGLNRRIGGLLDAGIVRDIETSGTTDSGRVREVLVTAGGRPHRIDAARFRLAVGADRLRSTRFTLTRSRAGVTFSGTGWGHGVGLCQEGARAQATAGRSWREILATYFPGATVTRI